MNSAAWAVILQMIPAEKQNQYCLVTKNGTEIAIQNFLRIENQCLIFRGRLAGSQDQGRLFFVSYDQIEYFSSMYPIKETDYEDTFGKMELPEETVPSYPMYAPVPVGEEEPVAEAIVPETATPTETQPAKGGSGVRPSVRSLVLERFRNGKTGK
jgi:hypothetical protein